MKSTAELSGTVDDRLIGEADTSLLLLAGQLLSR